MREYSCVYLTTSSVAADTNDTDTTPPVRPLSFTLFPSSLNGAGEQSDNLENTLWRDPPEYFEQVVYPAYVRAHEHMLSDGDVEKGTPNGVVKELVLIEGEELGMDEIFERSCEAVEKVSVPVQS
jgi:hypothetical protein